MATHDYEEWTREGDEGEEESSQDFLPSYQDVLDEAFWRRAREALHTALEALGVSAEEALRDPNLYHRVEALARAFHPWIEE